MSRKSRTRFSVFSGSWSRAASRLAPLRPSSSSDMARMRFIRTKAVSAMAKTADVMSRTKMALRVSQSVFDTSLASLELPEAGHELPFPLLHHGRLVVLLVVEPQEVEDAMDDEKAELVVDRHTVVQRLALRHLGADDDVAHQDRGVGRLGRRAGATVPLVGLAAAL